MLNNNPREYTGKHVIIVEDDVPSVKYYETILTNTGATVTVLRNGREFTSLLEREGSLYADMVIMDYLIPVVNGVNCTRVLRRKDKSTPVVMITAYFSEEIKREAYIAGCNDFILKPVFPANFMMMLDKYLLAKSRVISQ